MELNLETLQQFVSTKDLVTVAIIWLIVKNKAADHFKTIEANLKDIGKNIIDLKDSLVALEKRQTNRINNLTDRVANIENQITQTHSKGGENEQRTLV